MIFHLWTIWCCIVKPVTHIRRISLHHPVSNMDKFCSTFQTPFTWTSPSSCSSAQSFFPIRLRAVCVWKCNWLLVEVWWSSSRCCYNPDSPDIKCSPTHSCYFHQKAWSPPPPPAPSPLPFLVIMQKERRGGRHPPMQGRASSVNLPACVYELLVLMKTMKQHSQQTHIYTHKSICDWNKTFHICDNRWKKNKTKQKNLMQVRNGKFNICTILFPFFKNIVSGLYGLEMPTSDSGVS